MTGDGEYLIVDGYNIINDWPEFAQLRREDLAHARKSLIEILIDYQALTEQKLILVFDAHQVKGKEQLLTDGGIRIIFSREGQTADQVIEKLVYRLAKDHRVTVATSDWLEQRLVSGKGGLRLSAREFRQTVMATRQESKRHYRQGQRYFPLANRLEKDLCQNLEKLRRG